jgi:RHS repeat-associated protein
VTQGGQTTAFTYDGDGRLVKREAVTDTVVYVGSHYEARFEEQNLPEDLDDDCDVDIVDIMLVASRWGTSCDNPDPDNNPDTPNYDPLYDLDGDCEITVVDIMMVAARWRETCEQLAETTKYYWLGDRRVAMRREPVEQPATLYYLFSDHLGSTSVAYDTSSGTWVTQRYYPWGTIRPGDGNALPTEYTFTGQRWDEAVELMDYKARWYDPALGRFIQPDPLVPEPGNPQALNRYAYGLNNPVRYRDPSGYWVETAWDIANILWDIYEVRRDPSLLNIGALVVDVGAALLPVVPAGVGIVARGGRAVARTEDILDLVRAVSWTERFAGAGPEVRRGIGWLEKLVKSERVFPPYRRGLAAELLRAEELFKAGKLKAVEAVVEGGRVDLILVTDEIVEVKYWRESYASGQIERLLYQLQRYHEATERPVILELVQTKTDPITEAFINELLKKARQAEFPLTRERIRIITLGGP